jgi:mono/diheme cytochrome c family protein
MKRCNGPATVLSGVVLLLACVAGAGAQTYQGALRGTARSSASPGTDQMRVATGVVIAVWMAAIAIHAQVAPSTVFTQQQVDAGRVAYARNCAECHMPDLSRNNEKPPLAGATFMGTWGARTTKELLDYMSGAMPFGGPSLDADTYLALTAYILESNGAVAGSDMLTSSTAVRIGGLSCALAKQDDRAVVRCEGGRHDTLTSNGHLALRPGH